MTDTEFIDRIWRRIIEPPFSKVCKHPVAANVLSEMEQHGFTIPHDLGVRR